MAVEDALKIGKYEFKSRLFVGTGKYETFELTEQALAESGTDVVTVAIRRVDFDADDNLMNHIDREKYHILPNTAGCFTADDAIRTAHLARELGLSDMVKLEVLADKKTLLPDPVETLQAVKTLVGEGFTVLCYTSDDPVMARKIEEAGAASVMPAGSPIGSGQGILNINNIVIIIENASVPIVVDAGVGTASDVAIAMELGADGVLLNTGVAQAEDPIRMARAMKHAVIAGREAYLAGRIPKRLYATASSPIQGVISARRQGS